MGELLLEWNVPRPLAADHRGAYVAAYRDPRRGIPLAIFEAVHGGWRESLALNLEARGRLLVFGRAVA